MGINNLSGNEILRQLIQVLAMLSLVDVVVCGLTLDAGGNNARLVRYLLGGEAEVKNAWLEKISFQNVLSDNLNPCFVWFCSTHNLKSVRNQLMASTMSDKGARRFFDTDNICFGWEQVEYQWEIEDTRIQTNNLPQTELTKHSVFPDKWNEMRVKHAKAVF